MLKNKKNIQKGLALLVVFMVFTCMATTSFATGVLTTTTHNLAAGKVEVVSTVTGATGTEEVALLAYDATGTFADGKILYIDQKPATDGTAEFKYQVEATKINGIQTAVKFGTGTSTGTNSPAVVGLDDEMKMYNVVAGTCTNGSVSVTSGAYSGTEDTVTVTATPVDATYEVAGITANGVALTLLSGGSSATFNIADVVTEGILDSAASDDEIEILATFAKKGSDPEVTSANPSGTFNNDGTNKIELFGTVSNIVLADIASFGILVSTAATSVDTTSTLTVDGGADVTIYPALGLGTGTGANQFVVEVIDGLDGSLLPNGTYYTRTFVTLTAGGTVYGEVKTINP